MYELALPDGEQRLPALRVIGEQIGHAEPAEQIKRRLYGLPYPGS
jgi:hypothetical protein